MTKVIDSKLILMSLLFLNSILFATAQKNNFAMSFSNIQIEDDIWFQDNMITLQLEVDRNITKYFGIGGYTGFGLYEEWLFEQGINSHSITFLEITNSLQYGLNSNLHILPLFIKTKIPRFDLYISGKTGLISLFSSKDQSIIPKRGHYFDFSLMCGCAIYLSKKFGLVVEAGTKYFKYHNGFNANYGLTYMF
jgi:hypothetical protein